MRSFCKHFLLSLVLIGLLQGCGGGGGGGGSPPIHVAAGVYNNAANGIWTFLLADSALASNASTPNWFGIRFVNASSFELFSARVTGVGSASATGTVTGTTPTWNTYANNRNGTASLSMSQAGQLSNQLSLPSISLGDDSKSWLTDSLASNAYTSTNTASNLSGSWTGAWYLYPNSIRSNSTISILNQQVTLTSGNVVYNCDLSRIQLSPVSGANAYLVTVTVPADTLCNLSNSNANTPNNTTYNGLAFLINNPVTTKTTLFLMATAPDYRTLFFKGDQP